MHGAQVLAVLARLTSAALCFRHALPFNLQAEAADASLLTAAVELTHNLDTRFGLAPKFTVNQVRRQPVLMAPARHSCTEACAG